MSVNNDTALTGPYYPNGVTTVFPFSFISMSVAEVLVVIDDVFVDPELYTVTRYDSGAGSVTFLLPPAAGTLYVVSAPIFLETINFDRFGPFFPDFVNKPFWREAVRSIYLKGQTDRSLKVPIGETPPVFPSIDDAEGLVVGVSGGALAMLPQLAGPAGADGIDGAPGGNTTAIGLWTAVVAGMDLTALIASGAKRFWTSGYGSPKQGAASYRILASVADATDYNELSAGGVGHYSRHGQNIWWCQLDATHRAVLSVERPCAEMFGAVADATYNYAGDVWSGTDNQPAIQAMLDYGTYCAHCAVYLSSGAYLIGKSLHAGWGETYVSTKLFGQGASYAGQIFPGTAIVHNFSQGMAINFQGQRRAYCLGIEFYGPNSKYLEINGHCSSVPLVDDTLPANWINPALWVGAGNRYSPLAAVTLDAYSGAQPTGTDALTGLAYTTYPNKTYPAASGLTDQFNRALSSVLHLEGSCRGYAVGIAIQPGNSDGNGDFVQIYSWNCEYCQYFLSVGQTQSRSVRLDYLAGGIIYCALTNNRHGKQNGQFSGLLSHISVSGLIRLVELNTTSIFGSVVFGQTYIEAGWQLGTCSGASGVEMGLVFNSIRASFSLQEYGGRGAPAFIWGHPTSALGTTIPVVFNSGTIQQMPYVADFRSTNIRMNDVLIIPTYTGGYVGGTIPAFMALVHNACLGWSCPAFRAKGQDHRIFGQTRDLTATTITNGGTTRFSDGSNTAGYREVGTPFWVSTVQPQSEVDMSPVRHPQRNIIARGSTGTTLTSDATTLAGDNAPIRLRLEGTFPTLAADPTMRWGGVAGTVLRERATGTLFAVYSYDGATGAFKARILSNYKLVAGTYQLYDSTGWVTATAQFDAYYAGWSTPIRALYGDFTAASAAVTNLQRLDGSVATAAEIVNGDAVVVNVDREYHLLTANAPITALNLGAKTMSLTGTGAAATVTKQRITGIMRQPPANL